MIRQTNQKIIEETSLFLGGGLLGCLLGGLLGDLLWGGLLGDFLGDLLGDLLGWGSLGWFGCGYNIKEGKLI
jgi:hypothetical protein